MKIWFKYLVAAVLGVAVGLVVPLTGFSGVLDALVELSMNLGRYALLPLLFFSIPVAVHEMHEERKLLRMSLRTSAYSVVAVLALTALGSGAAFLLSPGRIPLSSDASFDAGAVPRLGDLLPELVPSGAASVLLSGEFLLPSALLALILGLALAFDRAATKPTLTLFDSLSRILWQVNSFMVEILPLPLILIAAARTATLASSMKTAVYGRLLLAVAAESLFVVLALAPLVLFLMDRKRNPYRTIYGLLGPAIAGLVTGHLHAPAGGLAKHLKESLGVRRRAGAPALPLALTLGRAGTAMVTATAFIVILSSYSSLGVGVDTVLWMLAFVPASAFLLGAAPGAGPAAALAFLCAAYGRGFESGYILIAPVALPLLAMAVAVDVVVAGCAVALAASKADCAVVRDVRHFI